MTKKTMMIKTLALGTALGVFALVPGMTAEAAQFVVLESSVAAYKEGSVVTDSQKVNVPANKTVTLVGEDGSSRQITGPFSGVLKKAPTGGKVNNRLVAALSGLISERQKSSSSLGTIRSGGSGAGSDSVEDAWHVSVETSGDRCIAAPGPVVLYRQNAARAQRLRIKEVNNIKDLTGNWPAGDKSVMLPDRFRIKNNGKYQVNVGERTVNLTFHVMPPHLVETADRAAWMAEKRCRGQALALVRNNKQ